MLANQNGKQNLTYQRHRAKYNASRRKDYWDLYDSKKPKLTVNEYAKKYKYSPNYVRRLCRAHRLISAKFKNDWLILDVPVMN
jgi:hypothetical protein